jgi:phosphohistidine phosphatase
MKTLVITRHGKGKEARENQSDLLRELSPRGLRDIKIIGKELRKKDLVPGLILSSPAIRAVGTARKLADSMEVPEYLIVTRDSLYGNFSNEIFQFIESIGADQTTILLVGHNPSLLILIEYLSGVILERYPTLSTLVLDFDVERWSELTQKKGTLRKLFIPSEMR